jgi:hypothetical protein
MIKWVQEKELFNALFLATSLTLSVAKLLSAGLFLFELFPFWKLLDLD